MADDNDDATLAAAKREQLYENPKYGEINTLTPYSKTLIEELFPKLYTAVNTAETEAVFTPEEATELRDFITALTLSIIVPEPTPGVHGELDNHICNKCQVADHADCQIKAWCTVNDVEVPCICLQVDHTAFVG